MDVTGKAISKAVTILGGGRDVEYQQLRIARNPENGNLFLQVYQLSNGVASILGYTLKADGALLRTKPVRFAMSNLPSGRAGFSLPDAAFADNGKGIATWAVEDPDGISSPKIKIRQLTGKGTFNSNSKLITEADLGSFGARIVFDADQSAFLVLWDATIEGFNWKEADRVTGVLLDANTAGVLKGPIHYREA